MNLLTTDDYPDHLLDEPDGLRDDILACTACDLRKTCRSPVPHSGPRKSSIFFLGEAPGENEDLTLVPFSGSAGLEFDQYLFQSYIDREEVRVSNVVRCRPVKNATPTDAQVAACFPWTLAEIEECQPELIVAMGRTAIRALLGDVSVEETHGNIYESAFGPVFCVTHPAAGLHNRREMTNIQQDFQRLKDYLRGELMEPVDKFVGLEEYHEIHGEDVDLLARGILAMGDVSCDTEWTPDERVWCASFSMTPGVAFVVMAEDMWRLKDVLESGLVEVTLHSAQADLNSLLNGGPGIALDGNHLGDTMVAAWLLGHQQGLKAIARRKAGMVMEDYSEVVGPYQLAMEERFFAAILSDVPEEEKVKGDRKRSLHQKIKRAQADRLKDPSVSYRERWRSWDASQKELAVILLGEFPTASLADVPREKAIFYSARDADATERVKRILMAELREWSSFP